MLPVDAEDPRRVADVKSAMSATVQLLKVGPVTLTDPGSRSQTRNNLHLVKFTTPGLHR